MQQRIQRLLAVSLVAMLAPMAFAQAATSADTCSVKSRNAAVVIMVCAPKLDPQVLRTSGRSACLTKTNCNVWIWDDAAKAPAQAPKTDADMPKDQAATAIAIWVHDSQSLITLKRANAPR